MRCCKDLGIASELWCAYDRNVCRSSTGASLQIIEIRRDPSFIKKFKTKHCTEAFVEHVVQKKKYVYAQIKFTVKESYSPVILDQTKAMEKE